jgi:uncharacterized protein YbjT (DUF2867 family)
MRKLRIWLRDWWRGYTDDDIRTLAAKLREPRPPGGTVPLTSREWRAFKKIGLCG